MHCSMWSRFNFLSLATLDRPPPPPGKTFSWVEMDVDTYVVDRVSSIKNS